VQCACAILASQILPFENDAREAIAARIIARGGSALERPRSGRVAGVAPVSRGSGDQNAVGLRNLSSEKLVPK
jgi:hypothetical protein